MKTKLSKTKIFLWKFNPSSTLSYTTTKEPKKVNLQCKSHWGSWSSSGFPMIALSLSFAVIRVPFRFLIERFLFRVVSGRVFFEFSEIESSSLRYAVIDSSLHQCSFSAISLFFIKSCYYFFIKNICFVLHLL